MRRYPTGARRLSNGFPPRFLRHLRLFPPHPATYNRAVRGNLRRRILDLPLRSKIALAWRLFRDPETPVPVRAVMPLLLLYLAMPLDLIPDFIPVIGQLDDVFVVVVGLALVLWLTPSPLIEMHLRRLEHE